MVQAISGRWCARILATSFRMCLRRQTLMLGQQQMSFAMLLAGLPATTTTSAAVEPRAAASHAERAHEGVDGEPRAV
jgi:hypothetical protein